MTRHSPAARQPAIRHVIWDWNGTLLDDTPLTIRASIEWLSVKGCPGLTQNDIRRHTSRNFAAFFGAFLGRTPDKDELADAFAHYRRLYDPIRHLQPLAPHARDALTRLAGRGTSQSILSMAPQQEVLELVHLHGIDGVFVRIDGQTGDGGASKLDALQRHLSALALDPAEVAMIGDTLDDFAASAAIGVRPILVSTGLTDPGRLNATGAIVVSSLLDAIGCLP